MIIKILLLCSLASAALVLIRGRRSLLSMLLRRSSTLAIILIGALAVLFPDSVTAAAHAVGVGRGTDLILYALCVTFLFVSISLYMRLADLQDRYVHLVRHLALHEVDPRAHMEPQESLERDRP